MTLNDYLQGRRKAIESNIASERIAGNDFRLSCEKAALAEITALELVESVLIKASQTMKEVCGEENT